MENKDHYPHNCFDGWILNDAKSERVKKEKKTYERRLTVGYSQKRAKCGPNTQKKCFFLLTNFNTKFRRHEF